MKQHQLLLVATLAAFFCYALAQDPCQLTVTQTARPGGSWTSGDFFFQIYDLNVFNSGSVPVTLAVVSIDVASDQDIITSFWNLERQSATSPLFNVRNPGGNIEAGATLGAGYILRSPISAGAQVAPTTSLVNVSCVVSAPQPPSGCNASASASIVARSASVNGNWTTGPNQFFQIFDVTITNTGNSPINGGVITFGLPVAGSTITQWWELDRQGSSDAFNISFRFGPLQVGASQGAGIVVETSSPSQALPSIVLSGLTCPA